MIRDILQNDCAALYPVEVVIRDSDEDFDDDELGAWGHPEITKSEVSRTLAQYDDEIFSLISKCPYLDSSEVAKWHNGIRERIEGAAVAFLLTILPNVERITVHLNSYDVQFLREMIEKISRAMYDPSSEVRRLTALRKVFDVTIKGWGDGPYNHPLNMGDLSLLGLFAALPSVRSINGRGLDCDVFKQQQCPGGILVPFSPSIRQVHFRSSSISLSVLRQLLPSIKSLERITYSYQYYHWSWTFKPSKIVALLQTHARSSLVQLDITGTTAISQFSVSLREFEVLERIRIDADMLTMSGPHNCRKPQLLTEILPAAIEELELVGSIDENDAELMFTGLPTSKEKFFPNLHKVMFQSRVRLSKAMQAECEAAGVSLGAT